MEDFVKRMIVELSELREKLNSLTNFLYSPIWVSLSEEEKNMLEAQRDSMAAYYQVLSKRIDFYKDKED